MKGPCVHVIRSGSLTQTQLQCTRNQHVNTRNSLAERLLLFFAVAQQWASMLPVPNRGHMHCLYVNTSSKWEYRLDLARSKYPDCQQFEVPGKLSWLLHRRHFSLSAKSPPVIVVSIWVHCFVRKRYSITTFYGVDLRLNFRSL